MNLIFDKRDKVSEDHVEEKIQVDTVPIEKNDLSINPETTIKPKKIKKKGVRPGFFYFIIIPLIVMSLLIVYMFYFKKDVVLKYKDQLLSPKDTTQQVAGNQPAITGQEDVQPSDTTTLVTQALTEDSPENISSRIIGVLVNSLTAELKLSTLYLDENTFSAQIRTNSQVDLDNLYSKLNNTLPNNIKVDTTPTIANSQALISGTYNVPQSSTPETPVKTFEKGTFEKELSELVSKNNTRKIEFSIGPNQAWNNKTRALIFVKIEGSTSNCQKFVSEFLQSGWDLHVSKIILMPSNDQSSILVLRVFIHNPA